MNAGAGPPVADPEVFAIVIDRHRFAIDPGEALACALRDLVTETGKPLLPSVAAHAALAWLDRLGLLVHPVDDGEPVTGQMVTAFLNGLLAADKTVVIDAAQIAAGLRAVLRLMRPPLVPSEPSDRAVRAFRYSASYAASGMHHVDAEVLPGAVIRAGLRGAIHAGLAVTDVSAIEVSLGFAGKDVVDQPNCGRVHPHHPHLLGTIEQPRQCLGRGGFD